MNVILSFRDTLTEVWEYLSEHYFHVTATQYESFGYTPTAMTVSAIVFGLTFGLIIAAAAATLQKNTAGEVVRALLKANALSPESAMTLEELGGTPAMRRALRKNLVVRKTVCAVPLEKRGKKPEKDESPTFAQSLSGKEFLDTHAFYVPEELRIRASFRFDKTGTNGKVVVVAAIVFLAAAFVILRYLPDIFKIIDGLLSNFG